MQENTATRLSARGGLCGEITREDLKKNELLVRAVLKVANQVSAAARERYTALSFFDGLASGEFRLWAVTNPQGQLSGIALGKVRGDTLDVFAIGPDFEDVEPLFNYLPIVARSLRCQRLNVTGSAHWRRAMRDRRYRCSATVYEQNVNEAEDDGRPR